MTNYPESHHASQVELLPPFKEVEGNQTFDVCIVGAGFTGLSAAIHLAELGHKVALVEAKRVGWGASGRNGGQLGYGMTPLQSDLAEMFSANECKKFWDISVEAVDLFHELCKKHKIECDFKSGNMACAVTQQDYEYLKQNAEIVNSYGTEIYKTHTASETVEISGSNRYVGSIISQRSGHINPLKYVLGLAKAAKNAGVTIFENSPVENIKYSEPVQLTLPKGMIYADKVILGCNGYIGNLNKTISSRILPVDNYQAATEVLDQDALDSLITTDTCIWDTARSVHYFRITPDKRLVMGCSIGIPNHPPRNLQKDCRKHIEYIYPHLKNVGIDYIWGGTLGGNNHKIPEVGRINANVLFAQGYTGHGVGLAPLIGKYLAQEIHNNSDGFEFFNKVKHKNVPGGRYLRVPAILTYRFMTNTLDMFTALKNKSN